VKFLGVGRLSKPVAREVESAPRQSTPVYARDPTRSHRKIDVAKSVDDMLVDLMLDGRYREVGDIGEKLPWGKFAVGVQGCLRRGYAFDRDGTLLRMRRRGVAERSQTLYDVVVGITAADMRALPAPRKSVTGKKVVLQESRLPSGEETPDIVDVTDSTSAGARLSLSEGKDPLKLSVSECSTMTAAILAKKSSGKTYLGMVVVEEILRSGSGVPVVVVDPTGVWTPGLRCMADGTPSSYQVLTLGGPHGDLPLASCQGRGAAEVVEQLRPHPVVLDLSDLAPAGQHEVVADFGERIFATDKRSPMLIVLDEADEFAPQVLGGSAHQKRSLEILDRIVRRGRIKGLGTLLITQRAAVVSKNVLSQIDKLFLLCMVAPSDLDAVEDWLRHVVPVAQRSQCLGQLPSLQPGQAFYMSGGAAAAFRKFSVRRRGTYDSSRTPETSDRKRSLELSRVSPEVLEAARKILGSLDVEKGDVSG
jgi:hypothetical protein